MVAVEPVGASSSGVRLGEGPQASRVRGTTPLLNHRKVKAKNAGRKADDPPANHSRTVLFLCGRGGGGHKAASIALRDCLERQGVSWAHGIEILDAGSLFDLMTSGSSSKLFDGDEWYNWFMKRGFYRIAGLCGYIATQAVRWRRRRLIAGFETMFRKRQPDVVVAFVPYFNVPTRTALLRTCPRRKLITVVTDMSNWAGGHLWIDPYDDDAINHIMVAGCPELVDQTRALGYPEDNILISSGMVVNPAFYEHYSEGSTSSAIVDPIDDPENPFRRDGPALESIADARQRLGVERPLIMIFFGGFAPNRTAQICRKLLKSHPRCDQVILCGGNKQLETDLRRDLESLERPGPLCLVEGLVAAGRVREHMRRASCVVGKPGPGVVAEANVCGVPFVTESSRVMPQERSVLRYIEKSGVGIVVKDFCKMPADLLERLQGCREPLKQNRNRAVFEVARLVRHCVEHDEDD